jgi:hypothetical protein
MLRSERITSLSVRFMHLFLPEEQVHSGLSLISPGQPLTLPRATVHSRLLGRELNDFSMSQPEIFPPLK